MVEFVGREDEIARLHEVWRQVRGGTTRIVAIEGAAGVGKPKSRKQ